MNVLNLMLNDLVSVPNHRTGKYEVSSVLNIYNDNSIPEKNSIKEKYGNICANDEVKPIKVNNSFWEKNGFRIIGNTQVVLNGDPAIHFEKTFSSDEYYSAHILSYAMPMRYVHEVQRVLRCVGKIDLANNIKV